MPSATREGLLGEIIEAPARAEARRALEVFREEYGSQYPKRLAKLGRYWKPLTAFCDYPAGHWRFLRTTTPVGQRRDRPVAGPA